MNLVCERDRGYKILRGTTWTLNTWGLEKFEIFNRNRRISWKQYELGPSLTGSHRLPIDLCGFQ